MSCMNVETNMSGEVEFGNSSLAMNDPCNQLSLLAMAIITKSQKMVVITFRVNTETWNQTEPYTVSTWAWTQTWILFKLIYSGVFQVVQF